MTPYEFELAMARSRMKSDTRTAKALRLVFVDGYRMAAAARECGISRQAVDNGIRRLKRQFKRVNGAPIEWAVVTVCVPPQVARQVKSLERAAMADAQEGRRLRGAAANLTGREEEPSRRRARTGYYR